MKKQTKKNKNENFEEIFELFLPKNNVDFQNMKQEVNTDKALAPLNRIFIVYLIKISMINFFGNSKIRAIAGKIAILQSL